MGTRTKYRDVEGGFGSAPTYCAALEISDLVNITQSPLVMSPHWTYEYAGIALSNSSKRLWFFCYWARRQPLCSWVDQMQESSKAYLLRNNGPLKSWQAKYRNGFLTGQ